MWKYNSSDIVHFSIKKFIKQNNVLNHIGVACDGTRQKRGFKSKNGVVTVTRIDTGK